MRGYMSLAGRNDAKEIPVEGRVGLYRIQERNQQVFAEVDGNTIPLGVSDPTVSRKKDAAPVVIVPREEFVEVRNNGNHNPVKVDEKATDTVDTEVAEGAVATVSRDAIVEIGYQTELNLVVERSRKKEVNVSGEKVVMGDEYDHSTTVEDSVVNRSSVGDDTGAASAGGAGAGAGGASVEDSVVNRSNVGGSQPDAADAPASRGGEPVGTETQSYCDVHDRTFDGEECPQCAADADSQRRPVRSEESAASTVEADADGATEESKYCMFCGEEIPAAAAHCPACGERLPD